MKFLQRIAYLNVGIYPFTSIFLIVYCFLPALSLFSGQFFDFAKVFFLNCFDLYCIQIVYLWGYFDGFLISSEKRPEGELVVGEDGRKVRRSSDKMIQGDVVFWFGFSSTKFIKIDLDLGFSSTKFIKIDLDLGFSSTKFIKINEMGVLVNSVFLLVV